MAINLSAEQVKEKHVSRLPADVGPLYHALYNALTTTYLSWMIFKDLFAKSKQRVDLLNRTASTLFLVISETLRRDVLVAIARMTDSAVTGRDQRNATVAVLIEEVIPHLNETEAAALTEDGLKLREICEPIRTRRNKTLAHADRLVAVESPDAPILPGVTMAMVDAALHAIARTLNRVSAAFGLGTAMYEDVIHSGGVDALIYRLRDAELFGEARRCSDMEPMD